MSVLKGFNNEKNSRLFNLIAQRDALELEAFSISEDLNSFGPQGQAPAGLKDLLVDKEGFPRADIDVISVLNKRNRLAIINTDHKILMKQIEDILKSHVSSDTISNGKTRFDESTIFINLENKNKPFAIINEILKDSPAESAGLLDGDKLVEFENLNLSNCSNPINKLPDIVQKNFNSQIKIKIIRESDPDTIIELNVIPKVWGGRGLIGCHFTPINI
jgi:26S proteasome non-ATPase regulatory subunit 9